MEAGNKKNFKNPMIDFFNISLFVNGHPLKMQQMIKQVDPGRQLFKTVNFAFMKIFDFLVKIALFWTSLLFLDDSCHKLRLKIELDG